MSLNCVINWYAVVKLFYFQQNWTNLNKNSANMSQIFVAKILSSLFSAWQYYICNNRDVGDFGTKSN